MFENQLQIGNKLIDIKPTKMKYIRNNFYAYYVLIKKEGVKLFNYQDGETIFYNFLEAVFDNNKENIDYIKDELNPITLKELLSKVKQINEFEDEDDIKNV